MHGGVQGCKGSGRVDDKGSVLGPSRRADVGLSSTHVYVVISTAHHGDEGAHSAGGRRVNPESMHHQCAHLSHIFLW